MTYDLARLRRLVVDVPDFPKPGVIFKDICPLLGDPAAFDAAVEAMVQPFAEFKIDAVLAIESRGFLFGGPMALRLGAALVPVRKAGKLPRATQGVSYSLEYGSATLEMPRDGFASGARVLVVDDVLATGGTAKATIALAERHGAKVCGASFLIGLDFLGGAQALAPHRVASVLRY